MTEEELNTLVEQKLLQQKAEIVNALMAFCANPSPSTFKDAENIPDNLLGKAMDAIVAEVASKEAANVKIEKPAKKTPIPGNKADGHPAQAWDIRCSEIGILSAGENRSPRS